MATCHYCHHTSSSVDATQSLPVDLPILSSLSCVAGAVIMFQAMETNSPLLPSMYLGHIEALEHVAIKRERVQGGPGPDADIEPIGNIDSGRSHVKSMKQHLYVSG